MKPNDFFNTDDKAKIANAIKMAEMNTSGEIRLHVETHCKTDVLDRAAFIFSQLHMHKTEARNGVLFYLTLEDKKFAILGDIGINQKVSSDFWNSIKENMTAFFRDGNVSEGLEKGILMAGEQLKLHFPYQENDVNELSDEISYGK
ncbi:MAG: TPM domain-containing protein [Salinivirgaceae bacterium]